MNNFVLVAGGLGIGYIICTKICEKEGILCFPHSSKHVYLNPASYYGSYEKPKQPQSSIQTTGYLGLPQTINTLPSGVKVRVWG